LDESSLFFRDITMTDLSSANLLSTSISAIPDLTRQQFGRIPEIGLPDGRGISIQSSLNTSTASSENLNTLKGGQLFNGTVSSQDKTDFYRFTVRDTKNWSFLLSGLSTDIKLAVVNEETGAVNSLTPQGDGSTKILTGSLRPGRYYLTVSGDTPADSNYRLSLLEGNTYFVSTSGSDSNLGTYNAPYATIENATKRLDPGDTVMIRGGTYYDRVLQLTRGGTADRPITVQSVPGEAVIVASRQKLGPPPIILIFSAPIPFWPNPRSIGLKILSASSSTTIPSPKSYGNLNSRKAPSGSMA
jgi:hypothetical protein